MSLLTNPLKSILIASIIAVPATALAETAEEKGLRIALEADNRDEGFVDVIST